MPHTFKLRLDLSEISPVPHFVARQEELEQMHSVLKGPVGRRTAILHGLGGIGKTQLAVTYIRRHCSEYEAAIWLDARDEMTLKQSIARTAERIRHQDPSFAYLSCAIENRDPDEIVEAFKRWLDEPANDRWIVAYDSYDHPQLCSGSTGGQLVHSKGIDPKREVQGNKDGTDSKAFNIRPFLPKTDHGSIIVTTRSSAVTFGLPIKLGKLKDVDDCLDILAMTSRRKRFKQGKKTHYR